MYDHILVGVDLDHPETAAGAMEIARRLRNDGGKITALPINGGLMRMLGSVADTLAPLLKLGDCIHTKPTKSFSK